jgi:hypothetical protein
LLNYKPHQNITRHEKNHLYDDDAIVIDLFALSKCQSHTGQFWTLWIGLLVGSGTCSFNVLKDNPVLVYKRNSRKISANTFALEIDQKDLSKAEQIRVFGIPVSEVNPGETTFFVQEEVLLLDKETLENLQIEAQYTTIAAGYYPMTVTRDKVTIVFTLLSANSKN